jgi:hypothetical protein
MANGLIAPTPDEAAGACWSPSVALVAAVLAVIGDWVAASHGVDQAAIGEISSDARVRGEGPTEHAPPIWAGLVVGKKASGKSPHERVDTLDRRISGRVLSVERG